MLREDKTTAFFHHFLILIFLIILFFLVKMQLIEGEFYDQIAEKNYVRIRSLPAVRGEIYDRKFRPIAVNLPSFSLYIILGNLQDKNDLLDFIAENFPDERDNVEQIIFKNRFRRYQEIRLLTDISFETVIRISEKLNYYPSLFFKTESEREYSYNNHFTGHIGSIDETEFRKLRDKNYTINSKIGKIGLEKYYEIELAGKSGYRVLQVDSQGNNLRFFKHNLTKEPENGKDLILTIDNELQNYISSIYPNDRKGCVLVMNARTGGILSYFSSPEMNQNIFSRNISLSDWNELISDPDKPMLDRIIHGAYPPGSAFKPVVASLGLETGLIERNTKLANCDGGLQVGNRYFKCWFEDGHGRLSIINAMKYSCDVFFYDLSSRFELQSLKDFTRGNFITVESGIDLTDETEGFFPTEKWYRENYGKYVSIKGHKVNLSIGQGELSVTPLQICAYYNALANDGFWLQPHLLEKKVEKGKTEIMSYPEFKLPVSEKTLEILQISLFKAVNEIYGTGTAAAVPGIKVYGKTGSAENHMGEQTHAWFAGYAKWKDETIAFTVFLENAGHGGSVAAPLAGKIVSYYNKIR